jgi:arylsulfatase A-like enzyme
LSKFLSAGAAAGVAAGALVAGIDLGLVLADTGPYWLSAGYMANSFMVYLAAGAVAGLLLGIVWSAFRRRSSGASGPFTNMAFTLSFVFLVLFAWIHLYDVGLGVSGRRNLLPFLVVVPLALIVAFVLRAVLRGLLRPFAGRGGIAAAAVSVVGIVAGGVLVLRAVSPGAPPPAAAERRPNVVLFIMDTTRLDSLSCGGNPAGTTPNLDRLAAEGVLFSRAYAAAPWTPPSHASMFTGLYPSRHGTFGNQVQLKGESPTLAEHFSDAGYETFFISSKGLLLQSNGWARGFEHAITVNVEDKVSLVYERLLDRFVRDADPTRRTLDIVGRWLRSRNHSRPFFLFVNISVQHTPYVLREPVLHHFASHVDMSQVDRDKVGRVVRNQDGLQLVNDGRVTLNAAELDYIRCLYDGEGTYLDHHVGRFFDGLREESQRRRVIAVITSDHGELLGEHGLLSHGQFLYDELIHVPFILWGTAARGASDRLVTLTDIYPTLAGLAGIEANEVEGTNLFAPAKRRTIFAEAFPRAGARKAAYAQDYKYLWEAEGPGGLFDLARDPGEATDLSEEEPEPARAFVALLGSEFDLSQEGVGTEEVDDATLELLKALGYVQ